MLDSISCYAVIAAEESGCGTGGVRIPAKVRVFYEAVGCSSRAGLSQGEGRAGSSGEPEMFGRARVRAWRSSAGSIYWG